MEVNFIKKNSKEVIDYLKRVLIFCIAVKYYVFFYIAGAISVLLMPFLYLYTYLYDLTIPIQKKIVTSLGYIYEYSEDFSFDDPVFIITIFVCSLLSLYFLAKICAIFKKLDKLNFFVSLLIVIFLSVLLVYIGKLDFLMQDVLYEGGLRFSYVMYALIPAYFLYKYFDFLTKKYPVPFEKIGYYSSIEFYRDLWGRVREKFKKP